MRRKYRVWFKTQTPRASCDEQSLKEKACWGAGLVSFLPRWWPASSGGRARARDPREAAWPLGRVSIRTALLSNQLGPRSSVGQVPLGAATLTNEKIMPLNQE